VDARQAIADAIRADGPIRFDRFMDLALYGPGGFYGRPPVGPEGEFVTSPHVHQVFGELLARAIGDLDERLGSPRPLEVTEVGAGDGTLAGQLSERLRTRDVTYRVVERSAGARASLAELDEIRVDERIAEGQHVILAHELLDNLPFRWFRGTADGPREVHIGLEGDRFVERLLDPDPDGPTTLPDGGDSVLPVGAFTFVDDVAARLAHPGYALLIDYGGVGEPGGPVHGYASHRVVGELLDRPGGTDITVGVDFELIRERAEAAGLIAFPSVTQRHALTALGFDRWMREELRRQAELLDRGHGLDAVRSWSGRSRATLLVDPTALGRHRWLLLATPGADAPGWV
jgi:NADH dehydrogenase [ubiquinone] 1 alpha subcomplex assembly factor 7